MAKDNFVLSQLGCLCRTAKELGKKRSPAKTDLCVHFFGLLVFGVTPTIAKESEGQIALLLLQGTQHFF